MKPIFLFVFVLGIIAFLLGFFDLKPLRFGYYSIEMFIGVAAMFVAWAMNKLGKIHEDIRDYVELFKRIVRVQEKLVRFAERRKRK
jgi:hypothetical protein